MKSDISSAYVRSILHYDPETGVFTWRERTREHFKTRRACSVWNVRFSGKITGTLKDGYRIICIDGRVHRAHRLAWLWMTGEWPKADIDHIDLNRSNNQFANLRSATRSQNRCNTLARNTCGVKGVYWDKHRKKWQAVITINKRTHHLGRFDDIESASTAYAIAAHEHHGEFARTE